MTSDLGGKRRVFFLALGGMAILLLLPFLVTHFRKTQASQNREEAVWRVEKRKFSQVLRLNGTTMAAHSFTVLAPRLEGAQVGSMTVTKLAATGQPVRKGDFLVEFDPQAQEKDYLDKKTTYDNLVGQVAQRQGEEEIARAKDDTALKQAEDELKRSELELQRNEIVSRIDAEKNQEAADEAQATLKQLKQTYQLKRAAAAASVHILEIQRDRAQQAMRYAQSNAAKMTVHSPMNGVVVLNTIWLGGRMGTVQTGDQVRPGVPFMAVVDPSQMEVRVALNQVDVLRVHPGQRATMHLDAYPGIVISATLEDLSPLGHTGQFTETVRTFTARFSIQGMDPRLLPDLSAALDLDLDSEESVLTVPRPCLTFDSGKAFAWAKDGSSFGRREVKTGLANDMEIVVHSGLHEGDFVECSAGATP